MKTHEFDVELNNMFTAAIPTNREGYPTGIQLQKAITLLHKLAPVEKLNGIIIKMNGQPMKFTFVSVNAKDEMIINVQKM